MAIHIGTSGFSYPDWRGFFYPENLPERDMLAHYSQQFNTVEANFTYYRLPGPATFARMQQMVPPGFRFAVKANRQMTHEGGDGAPAVGAWHRAGPETDALFARFVEAVAPLVDAGQLACVLAQFPWSFRCCDETREYIRRLPERMQGLPTVVEFRNREWLDESLFDLLRDCGLGFCCVDEPRLKGLMPPLAVATSRVGYVRFHGRNARAWWRHDEPWQRYDYLYTQEELAEWVPRIAQLATQTSDTFVFFNNHYQGKAGKNARMLTQLLLPLPE